MKRSALSEWELAERSARVEHMARLIARGAAPRHVIEEMPDATAAEVENARARAKRGQVWKTM
ncbi:MAG TPA: hypothetical protein IAA15_07890 [Candidatus Olsenella pullicola]|nr:hypothetical protein [Candidatus Olsenella pullicola]